MSVVLLLSSYVPVFFVIAYEGKFVSTNIKSFLKIIGMIIIVDILLVIVTYAVGGARA